MKERVYSKRVVQKDLYKICEVVLRHLKESVQFGLNYIEGLG